MRKIIIIILCLTLISCGNNANKTGWSISMGTLLGGGTYVLTNDPQATITATGIGLALGDHIGTKFDEIEVLKQEVLNNNRDKEKSKYIKVDENSQDSIYYEIQPNQTVKDYRKYEYIYTKNGETNHGKGFACLNEKGIWQELFHKNGYIN